MKDVEPQSGAETQKVLSNSKYGLRLRPKETTSLSVVLDSHEGFDGCIDYIWLSCFHSRLFGFFSASSPDSAVCLVEARTSRSAACGGCGCRSGRSSSSPTACRQGRGPLP